VLQAMEAAAAAAALAGAAAEQNPPAAAAGKAAPEGDAELLASARRHAALRVGRRNFTPLANSVLSWGCLVLCCV
jgi:hypothetical protein